MKRHPSLHDLSSDHHHGLLHVRRLMRTGSALAEGVPDLDPPKVAHKFLHYWTEHANRHFRAEEEILLPAFARYGDPTQAPIARMLIEHVQIRRLVADLQQDLADGNPGVEVMHELGALLRCHIRYEEDVVFPLIEAAMPAAALAALHPQFVAFKAA